MLSFWRRSQKFVVHLVFWPIIAVFVIYGFERYGNPAGGAAAIVNNRTITVAEYRNAVQRMIDFYNQIFQGNFDANAQKQYRIKESALQQLINTELVSEQAEKMGLKVTDAEVLDVITGLPYFQKDGRFSKEAYDGILKANRMNPQTFESSIRKENLQDKIRRVFEKGVEPSLGILEKEKTLRAQKVNLMFLKFEKEKVASNSKVDDSKVQSFLKEEANQKKVKEYYDIHKTDYVKEEQVKARHILIKAQKGNAAEEKKALELIAKIQEELKKNSFEAMAIKYSQDPGSQKKGGDLDWFTKGRMVPEFEKAAFSLAVNEVTKAPVQSDFGFHLIKVEGKKPAKTISLSEAQKEIAHKILSAQAADEMIQDLSKKMASKPVETAKEIEKLTGVKWDETGWFTTADEAIPKVGGGEEISQAAMSLTNENPIAPTLFPSGDGYTLIKLKGKEKAADVDLKKIRDDMTRQLSKDIFTNWSSKLAEKASIKTNTHLFADEVPAEE